MPLKAVTVLTNEVGGRRYTIEGNTVTVEFFDSGWKRVDVLPISDLRDVVTASGSVVVSSS